MEIIITRENYQKGFHDFFDELNKERKQLKKYIEKQFNQLDHVVEQISKENFWSLFPEIIGIDARLSLITELMKWNDFSDEEIIKIVETDYPHYFKELCGYNLNSDVKHSLFFHAL